jgi:hypothetical protein
MLAQPPAGFIERIDMKFRERHPSYLLSLTAGVAVIASLFSTQTIVAPDASVAH